MHNLTKSVTTFLSKCLALAQSKDSLESKKSKILAIITLGIWLAIVIYTTSKHEFWRDEVRALSLARAAIFPTDLFGLIKYDGHPVLWYLLLYIGKVIIDVPLILPITSLTIAFAAVAVFLFFSPFPFWFKSLFIFGGLPLYEYSVMARNYGISMLLMFVTAVLYRHRARHPLWLAFVLALLANTNVHSAILVCLIAGIWAWETFIQRRTQIQSDRVSLSLAITIILAGLLLCFVFAMPRDNTILTSVNDIRLSDFIDSFFAAAIHPQETFFTIVPSIMPPLVASLLLYLAIAGLMNQPVFTLAALGAQISLGIFFREIYGGGYRHQGLFLVFLLFLYWIFIESRDGKNITRAKHLLFNTGLFVAMFVLILGNIPEAKRFIWEDINLQRSSSKAFGDFLSASETYQDAIIVPEPAYLLEALPYYAQNRMYLPREQRFGTTVSWTTEANVNLSLSELLSTARDLQTRYAKPVLIVIGHQDFATDESAEKEYSYNKVFTWSEEERADFYRSTILVANFDAAYSDENYRVYELK